MEVINLVKSEITIRFSKEEIGFLNNAINETLNALEDWEFSIRTGWTQAEARKLLNSIHQSIDLIPK